MRLTRLYLAGFKSFAAPTEIRLAEGTLAIVGPNGCGKSNLIDALRWVMGESSARHLRGQALDDLIFAGSGSRSAASRAVVELTLDNRERRIHGPFAAYNELTVRRSLDRDGQSRYEINNTRVRRRDVIDLFLGTGVGARSYSVIEQGQVNRIVDAKPDELRGYLEEAAGISVYRERRRETANRISHTEENLARLSDIAAELERQEATLARQARAARRYRDLAAERRRLQVEAAAVGLLQARAERERLDRGVEAAREAEARLDATLAEVEGQAEAAERAGQAAADRLAQHSAEKYRLSTELGGLTTRIAELDGRIEGIERQERHDRDTLERRESERREAEARREALIAEQREQRASLDALSADHDRARDRRATAEADLEALRREVMAATEARVHPEREQARLAERCESTARECRRLESAPAAAQLNAAETERRDLDRQLSEQAGEIETLAESRARAEAGCSSQAEAVERAEALLQSADEARRETRRQADGIRAEWQALDRLIAAHAGNRGAAGENDSASQRLVDHLVEADLRDPWIGHVLGTALEAELVEDIAAHAAREFERFADEGAPGGWWLEAGRDAGADWLIERIGDFPGRPVDSLEAALERRAELPPGDFLITPDGWWVGRHWLGRAEEGQAAAHLAHLARRRELQVEHERVEGDLEAAERAWTQAREALRAERARLEELLRERDEVGRRLESRRLAHEHGQERRERATRAIEQWREKAAAETEELAEARHRLADLEGQRETAREAVAEADGRRERALDAQQRAQQVLDEAREAARSAADRFHRAKREIDQREEVINRLAGEGQRLRHEHEALTRRLAEAAGERDTARVERDRLVDERRGLEVRLAEAERAETEAREAQQAATAEQSAARERVAEARAARDEARARSEQARIDRAQGETREQHAVSRLEEARAQLGESEKEPDVEAVEELAAEPGAAERQRGRLEELDAQIRRLGAVNLSAIEDHREVEERREELTGQIADVESALAQLAEAIETMDRQTRERFRETFHAVNQRLGPRFESLFGGGEARLELTGDDPLDAGVALMARPPGKRISHLSLLSGGERALTATALIFAIFELNPAPFCILDEVDAPLDEANVGRFCAMVSSMSDRVQFMYITHNKTTMASASALVGVTMREAGVSRIVSVDIDAAVDLIEA
ncbi:AAA family ATPase [Guyparkeria sp.]|uniref:AAA family ATPase n=1 Tax=Guyparkeria sp. TaxID=2035736 RepID=UPI00356384BC